MVRKSLPATSSSQSSPVEGAIRVVEIDIDTLTSEHSMRKRRMRFWKGGLRLLDLSATRNLEKRFICDAASGLNKRTCGSGGGMEKKNKLKEQRIRGNRYVAYATSGFRRRAQ